MRQKLDKKPYRLRPTRKTSAIQATAQSTPTVPLANSDQLDNLEFVALKPFASRASSNGLFRLPRHLVSKPGALQLEILALRHQLGVLQRSVKRPKLSPADRLL